MANKLFVLYSFIFFTCNLCYSLDQASFYGSSYISIPFKEAKSTTDISFKFRTHLPNALILLVAGTTDFCIVRLENSKLKININLGAGESELVSPPDLKLGDLQWHSVSILRKDANLSLVIDGAHKVQKLLPGRFFELNIHYGLFIGGHGNFSELFFGHLEKFRGCLSQMKYNNMQVLEQARHRLTPSVVESVTWNCAAEFETTRQQAISFVEDNAYMLVTQVVLHKEIKIQFDVKTIVSRGILFYNAGYLLNPEYFLLQIWNNIIQCLIKVGDKTIEVINEINVSDGEWHKISFHQTSAVIEVSVDGKANVIKNNNGYIFQLSDSSYVGGVEVSKLTRAMSNGCKYCDVHFKGCIRNLYLGHISKGLPDAHATEGLLPGCLWKYPCVQNPCKHDGICVQQGIDSFQCQCEENFCVNQNYSETYKVFSQNSLATDLELLSVNPLEVMEGGSIVLTTANLHLVLDYQKYGIQDTGVHFKVIEGPSHGSMTVNVWPQESNAFSLLDVARDKVHYIHDGSEFYQDNVIIELDFTPTDSFILPSYLQGKFTFSITINIISVNDPPELDISEAAVLRVVQMNVL